MTTPAVTLLALSFLAPWAGLLAGLVGGGALVVLYLLRLRRKSLRVGSTMLWSMTAQDLEVNVPWKRPSASWLLLLQALAVLAIAGAIARPVIDGSGPAATRTIILIDASASMSATDGRGPDAAGTGRSRLDEARARAKEMVRAARATPGARLMVASFAARAEVRTNWTRDRAALEAAIDAVAPTDQPGDLGAAIDLVASLVSSGAGDAGIGGEVAGPAGGAPVALGPVVQSGQGSGAAQASVTTVVLVSDGGFAPLSDRGVPAGADLRLLRCGPEPSPTAGGSPGNAGVEVASTAGDNAGIVSASARRDYDDPGTLRVSARLVGNNPAPRRLTLRAELRDELVGTSIIELPAARFGTPAEATVSFSINDRAGGVLSLRLMNPDALASDNRVWMSVDEPGRPRIVLVGPGEGGVGADAFLRAFQQAAGASPFEVIGREELAQRLASPAGLEGVELLILDRVTPATLPVVPTISVGAGLPGAGVSVRAGTSPVRPDLSRVWRAVRWDRQHPVMRDVDLGPVEFFGSAGAGGVLELSGLSTALATGPEGPIVAATSTGAVKRLVIGPSVDASTWGADVSLAVMLGNAIDWLTPRGQAGGARWTTTSRVASVVAAPGVSSVTVTDPLGALRRIQVPGWALGASPDSTARSPEVGREVALGVPALVGVYAVTGVATSQGELAVNLMDEHETLIETSSTITLGPSVAAVDAGAEGTGRREVWPWLVMAAMALLALESVVFAIRQRG